MSKERKQPEPENEPDVYDIVEPDVEEPVTRFDPKQAAAHRPEVDLDIDTDIPPPMDGVDDSVDPAVPKLMQGIPEPKFVDPQVQASRREEQRLQAAREAEEAAEAKARMIKSLAVVALVLAALAVLWFWVF
ncbi:MAG: hypothetical protein IT445_06020 [Phycisphaeraceae bacterium]|nr:hypothetical protein [Phycisphaeraceae bacterium]